MKLAVKDSIIKTLHDCPKNLEELLDSHCGQSIIAASHLIWTGDVEKAFEKGIEGVKEHWNKMKADWVDLMKLARTKLSPQKKKTLDAVIISEIHTKEVVERLWKNQIKEADSF